MKIHQKFKVGRADPLRLKLNLAGIKNNATTGINTGNVSLNQTLRSSIPDKMLNTDRFHKDFT